MTWLVAVAEYGRQDKALSALGDLDFTTYCPKYQHKIVRCGRKILKLRALFGRYFFVRICSRWEAIFGIRGISHVLVGPGEKPLLVRDRVIDEIKSREVGGVIDRKLGFYRGQRVIPKSGSLGGFEGKFERITTRDREVAFFDILGEATQVVFAPGILEASDRAVACEQPKVNNKKGRRRQRRSNFKNAGQVTHRAAA